MSKVEDIAQLQKLVVPHTEQYLPPFINPYVYEDLFDFFHVAQLAFQQLQSVVRLETDQSGTKLLSDFEYFSAKLEHWFTPSWYNNIPYRYRAIVN